jgi:WD40 repeat protein/serine/threonine protein kinase
MSPSSSERNPVEELAEEFAERLRRGERPSLSEYVAKYPEHADEIRELFPALDVMEQLKPQAGDLTGAGEDTTESGALRRLERLGEFRILREVGRGGMGVVYEAMQESLGRHVALKVLPGHALASPSQLERFRREARAAGRLHHTNIVPVFGTGECDGIHYYAMQFIQGQGLDRVLQDLRRLCAAEKPRLPADDASVARAMLSGEFTSTVPAADTPVPPPERPAPAAPPRSELTDTAENAYHRSVARVALQVAEALAYAHKQGIVHRDIKPSNLLLDLQGTIWVTDFGLAKAEDSDDLTHTGDIVGTIRFMAPERFDGRSLPQSDVYSLGVTLYELLTLRPAFEETNRVRLVEQVLHQPPVPPRTIDPRIPRDLETIALKCLAKEAGERYPTAEALGEDLRRFLSDRPVQARRAGPTERLWRWCRRNRMVASLAAAVALLLVAVAAGAVVVALRLARDRDTIAAARVEADRNAGKAEQAREEEEGQRRRAEENSREARRQLSRLCVANGTRLLDEGDRLGSLVWFAEALKHDAADPDRAERHRARLTAVLRQNPRLLQMWYHDKPVYHVALSPDGRFVAAASGDLHFMARASGAAWMWDARSGKAVGPPLKHTHPVYHAVFSPDSARLITGSGGYVSIGERMSRADGEARVWEAATGKPITPPMKHGTTVTLAQFTPDGGSVITVSGSSGNGVAAESRRWEAATGKPLGPPLKHNRVHHFAISPDGTRAAVGSWMDAQVLDLLTGAPGAPLMKHDLKRFAGGARGGVNHVAFSPDGRRVATASGDETARVWDALTGNPITPPLRHSEKVNAVAFSPDGRRVATASDDETVCVWDAATGNPVFRSIRHRGHVTHVAFSHDGRRLVTISGDAPLRPSDTIGYPTVRVWDAATGEAAGPLLQHGARVTCAAFSADSRLLVTASMDGLVRLWELEPGEPATHAVKGDRAIKHAAFGPDQRLFILDYEGAAHVWNLARNETVPLSLKLSSYVNYLAFRGDGRRLVTANGSSPYGPFRHGEERGKFPDDWQARVWDADTGQPVTPPLAHKGYVYHAAFSPDGRRVVTASDDKTARVWDADTGKPLTEPLAHGERVLHASFSPDGGRVATASWDGMIRVWDAATGEVIGPPLKAGGSPNHASFSPDGRMILSVGYDRTARLWEVATGQLLAAPVKHDSHLHDSCFRAGGCRILVARDQVARVWDMTRGEPVTPLLRHDDLVIFAAFSPDGRSLVTTSIDGTARVCDAETGEPLTPPLPHGARQGERWGGPYGRSDVPRAAFSADGRRLITVGRNAARVWDLHPDDRPVADVVLIATLLSGHQIDASGSYVPVSPQALRDAWKVLRARYPELFISSFEKSLSRLCPGVPARNGVGAWPVLAGLVDDA